MSDEMTLAIVPAPTEDGMKLAEGAYHLAESLGYTAGVVEPVTQWNVLGAIVTCDAVLFDGTITDERTHNYHAPTIVPSMVDHLLVAARSYLPINFVPARRGGAPDYPFPHFDPRLDGAPRSWGNDDILAWLKPQLLELRARGPRPKKVDLATLSGAGDMERTFSLVAELLREVEPRTDTAGRVFVSYRSRHWDRIQGFVHDLERGALHGGEPQKVIILQPRTIAYERELLTAMRQWQLLSATDRLIEQCREMVAYRTNDYLDSWWTRGEVITLAYRRGSGSESRPALRIYDADPVEGEEGTRTGLMPEMTEAQLRRMARWYAHTDPDGMGAENVRFWRRARKVARYLPEPLLRLGIRAFMRAGVTRMQEDMVRGMGVETDPEEFRAEMADPDRYREFIEDEVWSDEFWDEYLFECPDSPSSGGAGRLDVEGFLAARPPTMERVGPEEMEKAIRRGALPCPRCGRAHAVVAAPPRYLWKPSPLRRPGRGLSPLDTYVLLREPAR